MPVDQGEFEALYRTHYARLIRLCCLWLDDPHEAEDVVQEVLLKLLQVLQSPYRPTAWEPWLTRVTRNACHDRRRSGWWKWWRAAPAARVEAIERHRCVSPLRTKRSSGSGRCASGCAAYAAMRVARLWP